MKKIALTEVDNSGELIDWDAFYESLKPSIVRINLRMNKRVPP